MIPPNGFADALAARVKEENAVRAKLEEFAEQFFSAVEGFVRDLEAAGVKVEARRGEVEDSLRLELEAEDIPDKILFLTQHNVAYVLERPGPHGALYAFVVTEGVGSGMPVERFLVSKSGEVHCEGICAPLEQLDIPSLARRLVDAIWVQGRTFWTPLEAMQAHAAADLELPRLKGQLGFRPRTSVLLPPAGVRGSRER